MSLDELLANPLVLLAIGFVIAEWRSGREGHSKAIKVDSDILARLVHVESWQRDHNTIHGCVKSLQAMTEGMSKNVDRMGRRLDAYLDALPPPRRSPFDFKAPRDWIDADEDRSPA